MNKRHSQLWDRADLDTSCRSLPRFNLCGVLFDFRSFIEIPVFKCAFAHIIMLFLSYLVKTSVDRVFVTCKLAMKWFLMRMCASRLYPLKILNNTTCVNKLDC